MIELPPQTSTCPKSVTCTFMLETPYSYSDCSEGSVRVRITSPLVDSVTTLRVSLLPTYILSPLGLTVYWKDYLTSDAKR
ncbi:hypothetical protein DPMN_004419 [Dreissena polymorpha]|uniref:Uncharacterized protein n=1 Tax=Dreissena polymorpha TaxID=45954 RepID=A0A9D4MNI2_DREPO|nr:hypothetical protein DPMN_004419 [Dreissena polymorpha]